MSRASTQQSTREKPPTATITNQTLRAGDIIATRAYTKNSKGTRYLTGADVSHAILFTGEKRSVYKVVDSMPGLGVTEYQLWQKLTTATYAVVFRHRTATATQRSRACQWARLQANQGKPYDYSSAARLGASTAYRTVRDIPGAALLVIIGDTAMAWAGSGDQDASFMCSELIFRAYEIAGAPLIGKPAHGLSPGMLFKTDRLACLGRLM
jgi:uncharacterized protein YycO